MKTKSATKKINYHALQLAMTNAANKHLPKKINFDEAIQLLIQYEYITSKAQMCELIIEFSIPFKKVDGVLFFKRNEFMKWFNCNGTPISTLERVLVRSYIKEDLQPQ